MLKPGILLLKGYVFAYTFSCTKLRHYLLSAECVVVSKDDVVKYPLESNTHLLLVDDVVL